VLFPSHGDISVSMERRGAYLGSHAAHATSATKLGHYDVAKQPILANTSSFQAQAHYFRLCNHNSMPEYTPICPFPHSFHIFNVGNTRCFVSTRTALIQGRSLNSYNSYSHLAERLNHNVTGEEKADYDRCVAEDKGKQIRTPWHREGPG